jgi:chemotaxis protein methyltransferase CheR
MSPARLFEIELDLFVEAVRRRFHHDFRHYAKASLRRRLRSAMLRFGCDSLSMLQHRLLHGEIAFVELLDYLTVQVSELFRDPAYFAALREHVIPLLRTYPSIRIWVAGCSSGEEAYSLAILLQEEGLLARSLIYATDINTAALQRAREGVYPAERMAQFHDNYRRSGASGSFSDYVTAAYGQAMFSKALKQQIVFSEHNLATDQVFAEVQLVSCRNVLIYFEPKLQERALGLFRDALCHRGFLGLGAKESLRFTSHVDGFEVLSQEQRLFRKRSSV